MVMMASRSKRFGSKCKCGHVESEHNLQKSDSSKSVMKYQIAPLGSLPMGMAPNISYDARRSSCKICDCNGFEYAKKWGLF